MKSLALKSFKIGEQEVFHKELLKTCLNQVPQAGFTPDEMRKRIKVLDVLEKSEGTLELEDADSEVLKACVKEMKWALLNKDVLALCDEVSAL